MLTRWKPILNVPPTNAHKVLGSGKASRLIPVLIILNPCTSGEGGSGGYCIMGYWKNAFSDPNVPFFGFQNWNVHLQLCFLDFLDFSYVSWTKPWCLAQHRVTSEYFLANIGFDTAEDGRLKVCQKLATVIEKHRILLANIGSAFTTRT